MEESTDDIAKRLMEEYRKKQQLPEIERQQLEEKEQQITEKVLARLKSINYDLTNTGVSTSLHKEYILLDESTKQVYVSSFSSMLFPMHITSIIIDAQTEEMLYVRTGPMTTVSIEQFFNREEG